MEKRKKLIIALIIMVVILLFVKMCGPNSNDNKMLSKSNIDVNLIMLKELVYEDELCDEQWAKKFKVVGEKIISDANELYLKKYYKSVDDEFIEKYKTLGEKSVAFSNMFLKKKYKESSKILREIRELFMEIEEKGYERIF